MSTLLRNEENYRVNICKSTNFHKVFNLIKLKIHMKTENSFVI